MQVMQLKFVLLIEDDPDAAALLQTLVVQTMKCYCDVYDNIKDGYEAARSGNYDLILLDLVLNNKDGDGGKDKVMAHNFIWKLRSLGIKVPIIIISALWALESKLKSFGFGADEYITKPYIPRELIARIVAVVRRLSGFASSVCKIGPFSIHLDNREVYCYNKATKKNVSIVLTSKEYSILEVLATRTGIVPKETLLNYLYSGLEETPETKIIDVFVCKLRKKLMQASDGIDLIQTVWGRGYQMNRNLNKDEEEGSEDNTSGNFDANSSSNMGGINGPSGLRPGMNNRDRQRQMAESGPHIDNINMFAENAAQSSPGFDDWNDGNYSNSDSMNRKKDIDLFNAVK